MQPSAELIREVRAEQAEHAAVTPLQSQSGTQTPVPPVNQPALTPSQAAPEQTMNSAPITTATPTQAAKYASGSIYPEATRGINRNDISPPPSTPMNETKDTPETYAFDDGYQVGKIIFIYQLVAGLVFGLLTSHLIQTFHTPIMLAVIYVIEYLITLLYIPYHVVRSDAAKEPLWTTLIGTAVQTLIVGMGFALLAVMIKYVGSLGIFEIFIGIGFLIASYFLTKLSWGLAFSLVGKIKNKMIVKVIGIGLIALFVGAIAYHYVMPRGSSAANTTASVQKSTNLVLYHVAGKPSFSVDYYTGSKTSTQDSGGGSITYSTGHAVQGVNLSISNAITVNATNSCSSSDNNSEFNFQVQGSTGIVCVSNNKSMTSYIGYIQVDGKSYVINMFAFSYQQKLTTVISIFNSITIE